MKLMTKRLLPLCLAGALMLGCTACGGDTTAKETPAGTSNPPAVGTQTPAENGGRDVYTLGYNNFGQGAYPLDLNESVTKYALESMGMKMTAVNNQFTVDKLITDAQNQIAQGVDGMVFWSAADTLFSPFSELCESTKTPFALGDKYPMNDDTKAMLRLNPYFAGAISTDDTVTGANMAAAALEAGHKTAVIIAAAVGDINHDLRVAGFTETFEAGGGKVLGVAHCADPSEAVQKSNDLLTAYPEVECVYGSGGDYSQGLLSALQSAGRAGDLPIYGTDIDPNVIAGVRDGTFAAANGAAGPYCAGIAGALLINYLDGHPILDENGQAPMSNGIMTITVTAENVDDYDQYWIQNQAFTPEEYQALLYRNNPDVTWKDYEDLINNYNFESRMATKG
ncbi:MAG: sugar ABC transporter substrate-binding protein [Clostridia bacterium]|nr:sugar ABC transporter substrate-binding protein [Clostridia bacterium]